MIQDNQGSDNDAQIYCSKCCWVFILLFIFLNILKASVREFYSPDHNLMFWLEHE